MAFQQKNRIKVGKAIDSREEFQHAAMSGKWLTERDITNYYGDLPPTYVKELNTLLATSDVYVVYSYRTPIAYAASKEFTIPDVKYSMTTMHHQSIVKLSKHYANNY